MIEIVQHVCNVLFDLGVVYIALTSLRNTKRLYEIEDELREVKKAVFEKPGSGERGGDSDM